LSQDQSPEKELEAIREEMNALNIQLDSMQKLLQKRRMEEAKFSIMTFTSGLFSGLLFGLVTNFLVSFVMFLVQNPTHVASPLVWLGLSFCAGLVAGAFWYIERFRKKVLD